MVRLSKKSSSAPVFIGSTGSGPIDSDSGFLVETDAATSLSRILEVMTSPPTVVSARAPLVGTVEGGDVAGAWHYRVEHPGRRGLGDRIEHDDGPQAGWG